MNVLNQNGNEDKQCEVINIIEKAPKEKVDYNKRNVLSMEEKLFLGKLIDKYTLICPNLEERNEFVLDGVLLNFNQN